jgi:heme-degrading monooxygenase HmoA
MPDVYTVGLWTVKEGREAEFVAAWRAMGEATLAEFPDARGTLLHDRDKPGRFLSFGPWKSLDQVQAWRASAAFQEGVAAIREFLDGFEPGIYELNAEVSATTSPADAPADDAHR